MVASHNVIVFSDKVKGSETIADGNAYIATNVWLEMSNKYDVKTKLHQLKKKYGLKTVAIQGETYGDRIQRRAYGLKNNAHDIVVFHIWFDRKASRKPTGFSPWVRRAIFSCITNNSLLSRHLCG